MLFGLCLELRGYDTDQAKSPKVTAVEKIANRPIDANLYDAD